MKKKLISLILFLAVPFQVFAKDTIYNCKEDKNVTISWKQAKEFKNAGLTGEAINNLTRPISITLVVSDKKGILKGNTGQVDLVKLNELSFLEKSDSGNMFLWTVVPSDFKDVPTYVFLQKSYQMAIYPFAITSAYKCE